MNTTCSVVFLSDKTLLDLYFMDGLFVDCFYEWVNLLRIVPQDTAHPSQLVLKVRNDSNPLWFIDIEYHNKDSPYPDTPLYKTIFKFTPQPDTVVKTDDEGYISNLIFAFHNLMECGVSTEGKAFPDDQNERVRFIADWLCRTTSKTYVQAVELINVSLKRPKFLRV